MARPPQRRSSTAQLNQTDKWQRQLYNRIPLVGGWLRLEAARLLRQAAEQGNPQAAHTLALALATCTDENVVNLAHQTLAGLTRQACLDAIWSAWITTRHAELLRLLLEKNWVARAPANARLYSALRLERLELVTNADAEMVDHLVAACRDVNAELAEAARSCLDQLENQAAIDALCALWHKKRDPLLAEAITRAGYQASGPPIVRVFTALQTNQLELITGGSADLGAPLLTACQEKDPSLRARARQALQGLLNPAIIDAVCGIWANTRHQWLGEVLVQCGYVAQQPATVRVLSILKTGKLELCAGLEPNAVEPLLAANNDTDPAISGQVIPALGSLQQPAARDELCRLAARQEDALARQICLEAGFEPSQPQDRALYYFMTEQWQRYETLDFDQRLLRAVYETAPAELRARIVRKVQKAGRTDFLAVLAGAGGSSQTAVNTEECAVMVRLLTDHQEWGRLWKLALETSFSWSVKIIHQLQAAGWQPNDDHEGQLFRELAALASDIPNPDALAWNQRLAPQAPQAQFKVSGRINQLAFDPHQPVLAIASSNRKVAFWDFQQGCLQRVVTGFEHSVGKVAYGADGSCLAAERANTDSPGGIYQILPDRLLRFGEHTGTVHVLLPLPNHQLLTGGRDEFVRVWNLDTYVLQAERSLGKWPRSASLGLDGSQVLVLDDSLLLLSLPELQTIGASSSGLDAQNNLSGVARSAICLPPGQGFVVGKANGKLIHYHHEQKRIRSAPYGLLQLPDAIQGIAHLPDQQALIVGSADGTLAFLNWKQPPRREEYRLGDPFRGDKPASVVSGFAELRLGQPKVAEAVAPGQAATSVRLTSLCVSPGGDFLATGDSDASFCLWDLRGLNLPRLATLTFQTANHQDFAVVQSLLQMDNLPADLRPAVEFMRVILHYRARFDIQIEEAPLIQMGEFDITL